MVTLRYVEGAQQDEGGDVSLLEHISPIGWHNVGLYGQVILDRKLVRWR